MKYTENDYLTYQLYTASKSPLVTKSRKKQRILVTFTFLAFGLLFLSSDNPFLRNYFFILAVITFLAYPAYSKWRYKNHYRTHIRHNYKNKFDTDAAIQFSGDVILMSDKTGESTIKVSEIEEVNEIADYIYIKISTGTSQIIRKDESAEGGELEKAVKKLIEQKGIRHNLELDWAWK